MYLGDLIEFDETTVLFTKPKRKQTEDYGGVLEMGGTVEEHLTTALDALADGNPGLAELAASNDYKVNTMEIDIDADCTAILARRQPAAGDLRLVLAITRITTDLERIGDEAKKIARVVLRLTESESPKAYYIGVLNMGGRVRQNLRAALDALARMDSRAALQGAYATGPNAAAGAGSDYTRTTAEDRALAQCRSAGDNCQVKVWTCNSTPGAEPPTAPLEPSLYFGPLPR